MSRRRSIIIGVVLLALIVAAVVTRGFGLFGDKDDTVLTLYGNVDIREVEMAFRAPGRIERIPVEEGERVEQGELLATLDAGPVEDRIGEADARIAEARADLARLRNGNRPQEIARARAQVAAAQAQLVNARNAYQRREDLVDDGAISRDEWDQTTTELRRTEAQAQEARQSLDLLRAGARREEVDAAGARVQAAQATRASADTDLQDTRLIAASPGTVITRAAEPGSLVQAGETVLVLSIDRPMRVRAYVAEPDLARISPGMRVAVRIDGVQRIYRGTIGYISPRAEFTPKSVETESLRADLVYRLRIVVENPDDALRQGQPVTVVIPDARPVADD